MTLTYPRRPVTLPTALACGGNNGKLAPSALADVGHGAKLEASCAARAWNALFVAAKAAGHDLTWTPGGCYRTFDAQASVFYQRMTTDPRIAAQPLVSRMFMGQVWYLKPGFAMVATPGTSNHGLGLAVDMASGPDPTHAIGLAQPDQRDPAPESILEWLHSPLDGGTLAEAFGWSWETNPALRTHEPWHLHYFPGDEVPQRVLDIEAFFAGLGG